MKCCIYTVLVGGYERLNEQPAASRFQLPFICLTDDPALRSESWNCHLWPHTVGRDRDLGSRNPAIGLMPAAARIRHVELQLAASLAREEACRAEIAR